MLFQKWLLALKAIGWNAEQASWTSPIIFSTSWTFHLYREAYLDEPFLVLFLDSDSYVHLKF